jgi:hypothetical protein
MAFAVVVMTLYLRPRAVIGVIALCISIVLQLRRITDHHRTGGGPERVNTNALSAPRIRGDVPTAVQGPASTIVALLTWILVAYSRCIPILLLGVFLASLAVTMHAGARQAPSEERYRGRERVSYSLVEVLGWRPVVADSDPRLVFKQLWNEVVVLCKTIVFGARRWAGMAARRAWDVAQRPLTPFGGIYR